MAQEKWEYMTEFIWADVNGQGVMEYMNNRWPNFKPGKYSPETMVLALNKRGEVGWELVSMQRSSKKCARMVMPRWYAAPSAYAANLSADAIRTPQKEFDDAMKSVAPDVIAAIEYAVDNVRRYHEQAQMPEEMWMKEVRPGIFAGERWSPIDSVACYVPRGKGSFPSVALMTAIPAGVAGARRITLLTPPGADGRADAATLIAAELAGVTEVYRVGGAQAVAAAAYGTESVPRCLKIVGPGSPYLIAAKKLLADRIDPGMLAGPWEALVLADDTADGRLAALDLLVG